jgi:hypothetical protein
VSIQKRLFGPASTHPHIPTRKERPEEQGRQSTVRSRRRAATSIPDVLKEPWFDPYGANYANADDAYDAAVTAARTLIGNDSDSDVNWKECVFEIADENGETLFKLGFVEAMDKAETSRTHWRLTNLACVH